MFETKEQIGGSQIEKNETFCFACGPEMKCFNTCCAGKRLPLWPYDVLRLKKALQTSSAKILETYADMEYDPQSGWPVLRLRLDEAGRCPFVSESGCTVYEHRPAACRLFPLARAVKPKPNGTADVLYIRQETTGCLGWDRDVEHTPLSWDENQGLIEYNQANDLLLMLYFHPKRRGRVELTPEQTHAVIAALYNPDVFLEMMSRSEYRQRWGALRIRDAKMSDKALLLLGRDYLLDILFGGY